jgi:Glycosyl transferase family 8
MQSFFEWFDAKGIDPNQPWLILGKGPSFAKRNERDLRPYYTMSLNHVVREQAVIVAHMIDYDVVDACGESILNNAQFLVLPWVPHINNRPGRHNLAELAQIHPLLRGMNEQGRLLWYNHSKTRQRHGDSPVVRVKFFSAVAAVNLLAQAGVRTIRSLGVDGGATYSEEFTDLKDKTLLSNRRSSFDRQFEEIARTIAVTGIDYSPLDIESPVKVFIGATEAEMLPVKVLEYSIRKHASMSVETFPLHRSGIAIPLPRDPQQQPRTPFSFQRFLIPALVGYRGRAIYLDSDMQVFKDIRALWTMPFNGADLLTVSKPELSGRRPQFSVMVLNCETLHWDICEIVRALDEGQLTYDKLVYEMSMVKNIRANIGPEWNALEQFSARETALLHFTEMSIQPWVSKENPLGYLWTGDLIDAIDAEAISTDFVKQEIAAGHVRPSLLYQVENRIQDALLLPRKARRMDTKFFPPYQSLPKHNGSPWLRPGKRLRALLRHCYQNTPAPHYQRIFYDWFYR